MPQMFPIPLFSMAVMMTFVFLLCMIHLFWNWLSFTDTKEKPNLKQAMSYSEVW